jgi:hypothetical protein
VAAALRGARPGRALPSLTKAPRDTHATKPEAVGGIVYLRRNYHFGPHKISMYLKRYHDIQISPSGIWRILRRWT